VNAAGSITNIAIGDFRTVSIIRSLAGQYRSRHYHLTDEHVLYVQEGRMLYWERELDGEYGEPIEVNVGEAIRTGPLVVHQTYFPVNTTLLSMAKNPRDSKSHEADVVRVEEPWQTALIAT
jgi:mannose-6-phosphate isomerase-like protein (cupin superfamily)